MPSVENTATTSPPPTTSDRQRAVRLILRQRIRDYLAFDAVALHQAVAAVGVAGGVTALALGKGHRAMSLLGGVHRAAYSTAADHLIERLVRQAWTGESFAHSLRDACNPENEQPVIEGPVARFLTNPTALFGPLVMVLRSPESRAKGVLLLQYNYVFPLLKRLFNVDRILERYHLVLEPSWSGFCNPEVLCYAGMSSPVFVQAYEPRDRRFVDGLGAGLMSVPTAANWWVDHRIFRPLPEVKKDADIVVVAGWGDYKRHASFFRAMRTLRVRKPDLKILLVGYGLGLTADDIRTMAVHYGLGDSVEFFENLTQDQVNGLFNRARVSVLWSRKEGSPRAIIESMFADVPCIIREGFNYGHRYEYVNDETGAFGNEANLPDVVAGLLDRAGRMRPREWVMNRMSCQISTRILADTIQRCSADAEPGADLAVKVNGLHGMYYWEPASMDRFATDYRFLEECLRRPAV